MMGTVGNQPGKDIGRMQNSGGREASRLLHTSSIWRVCPWTDCTYSAYSRYRFHRMAERCSLISIPVCLPTGARSFSGHEHSMGGTRGTTTCGGMGPRHPTTRDAWCSYGDLTGFETTLGFSRKGSKARGESTLHALRHNLREHHRTVHACLQRKILRNT